MLKAAGNDADNSRPALMRVPPCLLHPGSSEEDLLWNKLSRLVQEAGHELNNGWPVSVGPAASSRSSVCPHPASCHKLSERADRDEVAG